MRAIEFRPSQCKGIVSLDDGGEGRPSNQLSMIPWNNSVMEKVCMGVFYCIKSVKNLVSSKHVSSVNINYFPTRPARFPGGDG